jgi:hypothetical protein
MSISVSLTALKSLAAALRMLDVQHVAIVYWYLLLYQQQYYNVSLHVVCYYNCSAY